MIVTITIHFKRLTTLMKYKHIFLKNASLFSSKITILVHIGDFRLKI